MSVDYGIITDMEPKLPSPDRGPDFRPAGSMSNGEVMPESSRPETDSGRALERREQSNEAVPSAENSHIPPVVIPLPTPPVLPINDDATLPLVQDDTPTIANDNEIIEKEWVDKAKKVIAETKDNPYLREQEVSKLQADYLLKRYGRKLGSTQ